MSRERPLDVICLGRAAVDLYGEQIGSRLEDMASFAKYLGGCPANISVGTARLGLRPAMLTRVGDEHMGRFVRETLAAEGVDVSRVVTDPKRLTALVILGIRDRDTFPLIFYRENCADMAIDVADFDEAFIASASALLVTGTHLSTATVERATKAAVAYAKAAGTRVVLDIDYRPVLWGLTGHGRGEDRFVAAERVTVVLRTVLPDCDLIVGTEEEIHIAGGSTVTYEALRAIRRASRAIIVMKRGPMGCVIFDGDIPDDLEQGVVGPGFPVEVYNVLGAGDAFMSGFLRGWLRGESLMQAATFANACGAIVVSRHGCAPAMPSWEELQAFLAAERRPFRLREDRDLAHLHAVTTRRVDWRAICALAFDHRAQLEAMADRVGAPRSRIAKLKALIAAGAREGAAGLVDAAPGVIVDGRYGEDVLAAMTGAGWWIARPAEMPGETPLRFDEGEDPGLFLRTWPTEQVAKCLVSYASTDPPALRAAQEAQLLRLAAACRATQRELLIEVIPPNHADDDGAVTAAVERLYEAGLKPDWWKLPPLASRAAWQRLSAAVRHGDPHCRGVLLLGLDAPPEVLARGFAVARREPLCRGFAVGRTIFGKPAQEWLGGHVDDRQLVASVAENFRAIIRLWRHADAAQQAATATMP